MIRISNKLMQSYCSYEFLGLDSGYFRGISPTYNRFIHNNFEAKRMSELKESISEGIFKALDRTSAVHFEDFERFSEREIEPHGGISYVRRDDIRISFNERFEILENIKFIKKMFRADSHLSLFEVRVHFTLENARNLNIPELYPALLENRIVYRGVFLLGSRKVHIHRPGFEPTLNKYFLAFFDKQWNTVFYNGCFEILEFEGLKLEQAVQQKGDDLNVES